MTSAVDTPDARRRAPPSMLEQICNRRGSSRVALNSFVGIEDGTEY
jgi:hypothetical protein